MEQKTRNFCQSDVQKSNLRTRHGKGTSLVKDYLVVAYQLEGRGDVGVT
jgi:hypothetical protein